MTHEELRAKLASMLLDMIMFQKPEEKPFHEAVEDLIFEGPCDTIEVTIDIKGIDRAKLVAHEGETLTRGRDHETMTVLCVRLLIDGKDKVGEAPSPHHDYILQTPSKDTPP